MTGPAGAGASENDVFILSRDNVVNSRKKSTLGKRVRLSLAIAMGILTRLIAAEPIDEYQMKAAFVFNFAKFVEWPEGTFKGPTAPIGICVLGESSIRGVLEQAVSGKTVDRRPVVVEQVTELHPGSSCHILFVSSSARKRWRPLVSEIKAQAILTVGESEGFASEGGVINLRIDGGKLRMEVNVETAEQEKLRISSKLLSLAQIVK